jgi:hypothetical protein
VELAHGVDPEWIASAFTFDATHVYYSVRVSSASTLTSKIVALSTASGQAPIALVSGLQNVVVIAVDATSLYFANQTSDTILRTILGKVSLSGAGPDPTSYQKLTDATKTAIGAITTYAGDVYWSETWTADGGETSAIKRMPKTGGTIETLATNLVNPLNLVVNATGIYWLDYGHGGIDCGATDGDLAYLPSGATVPTVITSKLAGTNSLAVANGTVFFALEGPWCAVGQEGPGSISRVVASTPPGAVQSLSGSLKRPDNLFISGNRLYYTTMGAAPDFPLIPAVLAL